MASKAARQARDEDILQMAAAGVPDLEIAERTGLTRQRVFQILRGRRPALTPAVSAPAPVAELPPPAPRDTYYGISAERLRALHDQYRAGASVERLSAESGLAPRSLVTAWRRLDLPVVYQSKTDAQTEVMYEQYCAGKDPRRIARKYGIGAWALMTRFERRGWPLEPPALREAMHEMYLYYTLHGTYRATSEYYGVPSPYLRAKFREYGWPSIRYLRTPRERTVLPLVPDTITATIARGSTRQAYPHYSKRRGRRMLRAIHGRVIVTASRAGDWSDIYLDVTTDVNGEIVERGRRTVRLTRRAPHIVQEVLMERLLHYTHDVVGRSEIGRIVRRIEQWVFERRDRRRH